MTRRLAPLTLILGLVAAACTATSTSTTVEEKQVDRLVILNPAGNIVTVNRDGSDAVIITDDAGADVSYFQPQWSPSSDRLAWGETRNAGFAVGIGDSAGRSHSSIEMSQFPFYLYWSPDGSRVGVLHNATAGDLELEMVDVEAAEAVVVGDGAPFYFSWSPDSSRLVAHVETSRFELIDADGGLTDLGETGPAYQAPQWTEAGIFHLLGRDVLLSEPGGEEQVVAIVRGPSTFVANGDGSRLAIQSAAGSGAITAGLNAVPTLPAGVVAVLDVQTGEFETVTEGQAAGYFRSPDGEALLIVQPGSEMDAVDLLVWTVEKTQHVVTYRPLPSFSQEVLPFFTQYAQSVRFWSPDSTMFAFAGRVDGLSGIWVQSVFAGGPRFVTAGSWVAWSTR